MTNKVELPQAKAEISEDEQRLIESTPSQYCNKFIVGFEKDGMARIYFMDCLNQGEVVTDISSVVMPLSGLITLKSLIEHNLQQINEKLQQSKVVNIEDAKKEHKELS